MALASKGTRRITVNGVAYRWVVAPDDGYMVLVVESADGPGQRLQAHLLYHDVCESADEGASRIAGQRRSISPGVVRAIVQAALGRGWQPSIRGLPAFQIFDADRLVPVDDSDSRPGDMEGACGPDADGSFRREECLRIWVGALRAFLGWTEERTLKWAHEQWGEYLYSNDGTKRNCFFHRQPEWYLAWLLMRERGVRFPPGPEQSEFASRLGFAMRDPTRRLAINEFDEGDWRASRERIAPILAEVGAALPMTEAPVQGETECRERSELAPPHGRGTMPEP